MTPKEILAENYDQIEGICRRLPVGVALVWFSEGPVYYEAEGIEKRNAEDKGLSNHFKEAEAKKQRGQRLVVIVTPSETLYQFV